MLDSLLSYNCLMFVSSSKAKSKLGGDESLVVIQVSVRYILKHLKDREEGSVHTDQFHTFSFSNCTEELGLCLVRRSYLLSDNLMYEDLWRSL